MTPERWRQVTEILEAALESEARDRYEFLDRACAGDADLRTRVQSLLASDQGIGKFLDASLAKLAAAAGLGDSSGPVDLSEGRSAETLTGRRAGPYRILQQIGAGGMGTVYLAERSDGQYRKRVAIKFIRPGLASDLFVRRFRNERQVMAALEHPNIARLLDGGATEDGLLYLVMEHVDGERIDAWCDSSQDACTGSPETVPKGMRGRSIRA